MFPVRIALAVLALHGAILGQTYTLSAVAGSPSIITTVAGTGVAGYSGDGGPATSAQMSYPTGLAVDGSGNLYIADYRNHRIRKVSPSGIITTVAGTGIVGFSGDGGPATSAQLYYPYGVAVDGVGQPLHRRYVQQLHSQGVRPAGSS